MITHELIERIEGEASIDFRCDGLGRVEEANIRFLHFRGMETILEGRHALDALVITPRVCGICGHSHLIAAARMLESLYRNCGEPVNPSPKASAIREITRLCELLQNHLKWFYLIMLDESSKLLGNDSKTALKALYAASQINKLSALFSGQWPHSSYALPGGVSCDPTHIEVMQGLSILNEVEGFIVKEVLGGTLESFEALSGIDSFLGGTGDFAQLLRNFDDLDLLTSGKSHGRFLVLGDHPGTEAVSITPQGRFEAQIDEVSEDDSGTFQKGGSTYAKNALYRGEFYETGPLARALAARREAVTRLHRDFGDSVITRVTARIDEIAYLLRHVRTVLGSLNLSEPSYTPPKPIEGLSGEGTGIVEAPRGSLIHRAVIEEGKIASYAIITPTQWNLGNGTADFPGVAQKAMIGAVNSAKASLIFRTFDVCSVCTTH